ncbi:MAG: hypothetical protein RTU92_10385, partial [Candidatus Thorarchaeota archaeon]
MYPRAGATLIEWTEQQIGDPFDLNIEIFDPEGVSITDGVIQLTEDPTEIGWPAVLNSGSLSSLGVTLHTTMLDSWSIVSNQRVRDEPYRMAIDTGDNLNYISYLWKYRADDHYTIDPDGGLNWAVYAPTRLKFTSNEVIPSDLGRMLPVEWEEYIPVHCVNKGTLDSLGRVYLDYASERYVAYANPITMQADEYGGGIVSYGLSNEVTYESLFSTSALTGVFMQTIAELNLMNLWSSVPKRGVVDSTDIEMKYYRYDELQVLTQDGWLVDWAEGDNAIDDIYIEKTFIDENGADYFVDEYDVRVDPYQETEFTTFADGIEIRPSVREMNNWDAESVEYWDSVISPILVGKPVPDDQKEKMVDRHQQLYATHTSFTVNDNPTLGGLDLSGGKQYWMETLLVFGEDDIRRRTAIISEQCKTLHFDLRDTSTSSHGAGNGVH